MVVVIFGVDVAYCRQIQALAASGLAVHFLLGTKLCQEGEGWGWWDGF